MSGVMPLDDVRVLDLTRYAAGPFCRGALGEGPATRSLSGSSLAPPVIPAHVAQPPPSPRRVSRGRICGYADTALSAGRKCGDATPAEDRAAARDRGRGRRDGGHRRRAARARDPAQLPHRGALPLLARGRGARAAPVHRDQQQRGVAVQSRPAALDLRFGEAREQLLRVRHRQRPGAAAQLCDREALGVPAAEPGAGRARLRSEAPPAGREGGRSRARAAACVPTALDRERLGHELRLAERERGSRPQRGGAAGRLPPEHGRGRAVATPRPRRRADLAARDRVLRRATIAGGSISSASRTWPRRTPCGRSRSS